MCFLHISQETQDWTALCWSPELPWIGWGPSHFPFHILGIYFSSASLVPPPGPHLPLRHPLFYPYLILSSKTQTNPQLDLLDGLSTCSQAVRAPHSFIPHLAGFRHHETPAYRVTVAPTLGDPPILRIRGLSASPAPHLGTQKCFPIVNHPGKPVWLARQAWEVAGNIPLSPILVEPQDQMRHMDGFGHHVAMTDKAISKPSKAPHGVESQEVSTLKPGNCGDQFFIYPFCPRHLGLARV